MPNTTYAHVIVGLDPTEQFGSLPIPDVEFAVRISRYHIAVKRKNKLEVLFIWFGCWS